MFFLYFFFFYSAKNKKNEKTEATEGDKDGKVEGEPTKVIAGRKCLVEGRVKLVCGLLFKDTIFYDGELWWFFQVFRLWFWCLVSCGVAGGTLQVKLINALLFTS